MVTHNYLKTTYSYPRVTYSDPKVPIVTLHTSSYLYLPHLTHN